MSTPAARPSPGRPPARRRVVLLIPSPVGSIIGQPGLSGLAAFRADRREVLELLLEAGLEEVPADA